MTATAVNEEKLQAFLEKAIADLGAMISAPLIMLGEKLGIYRAMAGAGPLSAEEVAFRAGVAERPVREWLANQAAGGYISYDADNDMFTLEPEQALALADETSPVYMLGAFEMIAALYAQEERITEGFRTGKGMGWHEHDPRLFHATERFFRPGYRAHLIDEWIPALDGVKAKLERGARVADVGCGHGASTVLMAEAFPVSKFHGFDYHDGSITRARELAKASRASESLDFAVAAAKDFPGEDYDLVCAFDCLHDMGDPVGAAAHILKTLAADGTFMLVEPFANDDLADNLNPVGRVFYGGSTLVCTPASLSQEVGLALGAQAGERRLTEVLREAGFTRVRRATETPFNIILEARP
jgi:SAM-dependent methyltransferase